jgi:hypothetical protein
MTEERLPDEQPYLRGWAQPYLRWWVPVLAPAAVRILDLVGMPSSPFFCLGPSAQEADAQRRDHAPGARAGQRSIPIRLVATSFTNCGTHPDPAWVLLTDWS